MAIYWNQCPLWWGECVSYWLFRDYGWDLSSFGSQDLPVLDHPPSPPFCPKACPCPADVALHQAEQPRSMPVFVPTGYQAWTGPAAEKRLFFVGTQCLLWSIDQIQAMIVSTKCKTSVQWQEMRYSSTDFKTHFEYRTLPQLSSCNQVFLSSCSPSQLLFPTSAGTTWTGVHHLFARSRLTSSRWPAVPHLDLLGLILVERGWSLPAVCRVGCQLTTSFLRAALTSKHRGHVGNGKPCERSWGQFTPAKLWTLEAL